MEKEHVDFPQFELVGPKCPKQNCSGVGILTTDIRLRNLYHKCSECGYIFDIKVHLVCTCGEDESVAKGEGPLPHKRGCPKEDE